ncbi:DNA methyltransferase [Escherichia coli]|uniref:DNA methyltransferase n=1 Tax=Escherichia coli TaxID=562 RepID=UPI003D658FF8
MSRFILGDCVRVMATFPDNAVDFILTDPPYLVGFRDRSGRTIAGDKTDEWLQPACNEMYRVLKKDALMVSFYGWNRVDRFMSAWKNAGFSVVGHLVFTKNYTSKAAYVGYRHECAYILAYSALFDHGLASKSDQRFASIRSTGNLTFSTAF